MAVSHLFNEKTYGAVKGNNTSIAYTNNRVYRI